MPRPRKFRRVREMPSFVYFKPRAVPLSELEEVILSVDEFEALRLKDLENLDQTEAAKRMKIHQSTFQRTIVRARGKVTDALVNGKAIKIEGGRFIMPRGDRTGPAGQGPITGRGLRGSGMGRGRCFGAPANCVCPNCGFQSQKQPGVPCATLTCPKCNSRMTRG